MIFVTEYKVYHYDSEVAEELVRVSAKVAENWSWPYQHSLEAFNNMSSQSDFDPGLLLYCKKGEEIVGYILADIGSKFLGSKLSVKKEEFARVLFPRALSGHEKAADLLLEKIFENLRSRRVKLVRSRTSNMRPNSFNYLKKWGYTESTVFPLGYKLYYQYNSSKGKIDYPIDDIQLFDEQRDLKECSKWVAEFFNIPVETAKANIQQINTRDDLVSHCVIREKNNLAGYCYALPNSNVKKIHATFYIDAINNHYFKQLLVKSVNNGIIAKSETFIVDLIYSVLKYEEAAKSLGFEKVATWGVFEKSL